MRGHLLGAHAWPAGVRARAARKHGRSTSFRSRAPARAATTPGNPDWHSRDSWPRRNARSGAGPRRRAARYTVRSALPRSKRSRNRASKRTLARASETMWTRAWLLRRKRALLRARNANADCCAPDRAKPSKGGTSGLAANLVASTLPYKFRARDVPAPRPQGMRASRHRSHHVLIRADASAPSGGRRRALRASSSARV